MLTDESSENCSVLDEHPGELRHGVGCQLECRHGTLADHLRGGFQQSRASNQGSLWKRHFIAGSIRALAHNQSEERDHLENTMSANCVLIVDPDMCGFGKSSQGASDGRDANADVARLPEEVCSRLLVGEPLVYPGAQFLAALRFGDPVEDEVAGRHCWKVDATTELGRHAMRTFPVSMRLGGIDHTFWFDIATGIVLRHVGLVDDEPWSITEFKEVRINPPLTDLDFQFVAPPDAIIERQVDQLIRMAEVRGVDLTGVDREDPQAVREAMHNMMRPNQPTPEAQLELRKAKHVPVADPPVDEATARESIVYAFNNLGEVDDEGTILVNVQSGRGLVGPLSEAQMRVPGAADNSASLIVDDVKFLRPDEAVVWFSVEVNGERFPMVNGREGRAVRVGERWLIEHATIADLLRFAGVVVPSPDE